MTTLFNALPTLAPLLLPITLSTAVFGAMFQLWLTALVTTHRLRTNISLLDGGDVLLTRRIRAHANFTETMPMALLLMLLLELARWDAVLLGGCAVLLLGGRLLHAAGILQPQAFVARRLGMFFTLTSILLMAGGGAWTLIATL